MTVVIDTNVHLSRLITPEGIMVEVLARCTRPHVLLSSAESADELRRKLLSDKFRQYFSKEIAERYIESELGKTTVLSTPNIPSVCTDPNDDYLFALALAGKADFLVSGDKQVLVVGTYGKTRVVTPRQFLELTEAT